MGGMPRLSNGDYVLAKHPKLLKWMNICVGCSHMGYKPDLPKELHGGKLPNNGAAQLRLFFKPLEVNELGLCEHCQRRASHA